MHVKHKVIGISYTLDQQPINHTHENQNLNLRKTDRGDPLLLAKTSAVNRGLFAIQYKSNRF